MFFESVDLQGRHVSLALSADDCNALAWAANIGACCAGDDELERDPALAQYLRVVSALFVVAFELLKPGGEGHAAE